MIKPESSPFPKNPDKPATAARPSMEAHVKSVTENIAILEASIVECQGMREAINADIASHRTEIAEWRRLLPRAKSQKK